MTVPCAKDGLIRMVVSQPSRGGAGQWLPCASSRRVQSPGSIPSPASVAVLHGYRLGNLHGLAAGPGAGQCLEPGCWLRSWHGLPAALLRYPGAGNAEDRPAGLRVLSAPVMNGRTGKSSGESVPVEIPRGRMLVYGYECVTSACSGTHTLIRSRALRYLYS